MATKKELEKPQNALAKPAFMEESVAGTEDIDNEDVKFPRLSIAQGLSPQMTKGHAARIPELSAFDFFNDLTEEIYCRFDDVEKADFKPLRFIVCKRQVKRIEFDPDDRSVPIDLNVPANDDRNRWTKDAEGKSHPPRATKYVEFAVLLIRDGNVTEPIVLSIKETNKHAKLAHTRLSGFIKMKASALRVPIYGAVYTVHPGLGKKDDQTYGIYVINQPGEIEGLTDARGLIIDEDLYNRAKAMHEGLKDREIEVEREPGSDDDSFDPEAYDAQPGDTSGM